MIVKRLMRFEKWWDMDGSWLLNLDGVVVVALIFHALPCQHFVSNKCTFWGHHVQCSKNGKKGAIVICFKKFFIKKNLVLSSEASYHILHFFLRFLSTVAFGLQSIILFSWYICMQFGIVMEGFSEIGVWRPEINFGILSALPF